MSTVRSRAALAGLVFACVLVTGDAPRAIDQHLSQNDDAYIDASGDEAWTLGNAAIQFQVRFDGSGLSTTLTAVDGSGGLSITTSPESTFAVAGRPLSLTRQGGFVLSKSETGTYGGGVLLSLALTSSAERLVVTRHYVVVPGAPAVMTWSTLTSETSESRKVSNLDGWSADISGGRAVYWMSGLTSSDTDGEPFTLASRDVASGGTLALRTDGRSSDKYVPWLAVTGDAASFFGGVMWSGRWRIDVSTSGSRAAVTTGIDGTETSVSAGRTVEGPKGFFGIAPGATLDGVSAAMARLQEGLRDRPSSLPLVVYNTWFAYGSSMDETTLRAEAERAARLGAEVFVVDAGWWAGSGEGSDFTAGLGSWRENTAKFPSGLRAFADYVRSLGMKFGLWVEPERVALTMVGRAPSVSSAWLASQGGMGAQASGRDSAQICLGADAARRWVTAWLTSLIEAVGVDYLKWDNNYWIDCTRTDHGHGAADGSYAHVRALYEILTELRARYPDLVIENCAQGGQRLDLELGTLTDVAWMDDRTSPASRVRHNLGGLGRVFGAGYLLSFDMPEPEVGTEIETRSRMPGAMGIGYRTDGMGEDELGAIARQVAIYKSVRDIVQTGAVIPLTPPPPAEGSELAPWDATSVVSTTTKDAVIFVYLNDRGVRSAHVTPGGLDPGARYRVSSPDGGDLGSMRGADLMADGLDTPEGSTAPMLILRRDAY